MKILHPNIYSHFAVECPDWPAIFNKGKVINMKNVRIDLHS